MNFRAGQQIVCIDDQFPPDASYWIPERPTKGLVYTVRAIGPGTGGIGVLLEECHNRPCFSPLGEHAFRPERFRPVKQTSIEVFQQMLVTPPLETVQL